MESRGWPLQYGNQKTSKRIWWKQVDTKPEVKKKKKREVLSRGGLPPGGVGGKTRLETGPGGSYVLQRQTAMSLSYTRNVEAWRFGFCFISAQWCPPCSLPTSPSKLWCLTISHLDASQLCEKQQPDRISLHQSGRRFLFFSPAESFSCLCMYINRVHLYFRGS